ncbi:hypothetical protein ACH5RR_039504 [Cinchona calisaya]|uniref:RNase H type-1 domain-containing protein n=1 Tax=Cinchona calisaya TaxID=153742 RepID=A0ABD2Y0Z4_9GENT
MINWQLAAHIEGKDTLSFLLTLFGVCDWFVLNSYFKMLLPQIAQAKCPRVVEVMWSRDFSGVKLNVDGSSMCNPGQSRRGRIALSNSREVVFSFAKWFWD